MYTVSYTPLFTLTLPFLPKVGSTDIYIYVSITVRNAPLFVSNAPLFTLPLVPQTCISICSTDICISYTVSYIPLLTLPIPFLPKVGSIDILVTLHASHLHSHICRRLVTQTYPCYYIPLLTPPLPFLPKVGYIYTISYAYRCRCPLVTCTGVG